LRKEIRTKEVGLAIVYLKYNDPQQSVRSVLGSILVQLVQGLDSVPASLQQLYDKHQVQKSSASLGELVDQLQITCSLFQRIFLIIDALDECTDEMRWDLMDHLRSLGGHLHLLVMSRFLDTIDKELEDFDRLEIKANKADLEIFIDHHIQKNKNLRQIMTKSPIMKEDIKFAVVKTAEDMYGILRVSVQFGREADLSIGFFSPGFMLSR
jgi:hypothetical protein